MMIQVTTQDRREESARSLDHADGENCHDTSRHNRRGEIHAAAAAFADRMPNGDPSSVMLWGAEE